VGQKVLDEDGFPSGRRVGEISGDAVVERELIFFDEHHDRGGYELLGDRTGLHEGFRRDGNVQFHIGETVAFRKQNAAAAVDADLEAGDALAGHLRFHEPIDGVSLCSGEGEDAERTARPALARRALRRPNNQKQSRVEFRPRKSPWPIASIVGAAIDSELLVSRLAAVTQDISGVFPSDIFDESLLLAANQREIRLPFYRVRTLQLKAVHIPSLWIQSSRAVCG
jgi:hypothetical protein